MESYKYNSLQYNAMQAGTFLGIFFILKFPFLPLGLGNPFFYLMFIVMTCAVPFLMYYYGKAYRDKCCGGSIRFFSAWLFLLLTFVFASLLVALGHYIYFRYIDGGYILGKVSEAMNMMKSNPVFPKEYNVQMSAMLDQMSSLSPIKIVFQLISQNVIYGNILSLIVALFVMKRPK
jgi:hypothetical protein